MDGAQESVCAPQRRKGVICKMGCDQGSIDWGLQLIIKRSGSTESDAKASLDEKGSIVVSLDKFAYLNEYEKTLVKSFLERLIERLPEERASVL